MPVRLLESYPFSEGVCGLTRGYCFWRWQKKVKKNPFPVDIQGLPQKFMDYLENYSSYCWICMKFNKMSMSCQMNHYT